MGLKEQLRNNRLIRVIGIDDTPFSVADERVNVAGVVCARTRFEGMLWTNIARDGWDATSALVEVLKRSKFLAQLHLLLRDGVAMGGFNVVDLEALAQQLDLPCVTVMRKLPNLDAMRAAMDNLPDADRRWERLLRAGPIHCHPPYYFQVVGEAPQLMLAALKVLTDRGNVPEALRLAHLIGAAVQQGESGRRA